MRVLLVSHTCQSRTEGQPKAECLSRIPGIDLCVLVPDRWKHYGKWRYPDTKQDVSADYSLCIERVRWPWVGPAQYYLHWYPQLGKVIRDFRPDVIDLWEEPWALISVQACRLRDRWAPKAKIISETEQNIYRRLPPPFEWIRRGVLKRADFVVGRSAEAIDVVRHIGYSGQADVVPNAVDELIFRPLDRPSCRRGLGVDGFTVGYVGRLVEEKGLSDLVRAIALCPPQVNALIVGGGPYAGELERLIRQSGLDHRVRVMPPRTTSELPEVYNAFDVLAVPSRTTPSWKEQFGRVIIEAHACGIPVIGSDSGEIPNVIGSGGAVVPEENPPALAQAIQSMLDDPERAQRLGLSGLKAVHEKYTWSAVAQKMFGIYRRLTGEALDETSRLDLRVAGV